MAFTVSIVPHNLGDMKASRVSVVFDGGSSTNNEVSLSVSALQMSSLDCFMGEPSNIGASAKGGIFLLYDRTASKLKVYAASTADQIAASDTPVAGSTLYALAVGK